LCRPLDLEKDFIIVIGDFYVEMLDSRRGIAGRK
jgi:hypothetical protein